MDSTLLKEDKARILENKIDHCSENTQKRKYEILYQGYFYDISSFIPRHPGGNVIKFYTVPEEDATLAIQQFHHRSMDKIEKLIKKFPNRPQESSCNKSEEMTKDFQTLHKELIEGGYFKPSYVHIILRFMEVILLISTGFYLWTSQSLVVRIFGSILYGLGAGRCGWVMHEGGHHSLTGIPRVDRFLQSLTMGIGPGLSASWWRSQHNRHHAMPQRINRDVDLETLPLLAFNTKVFRDDTREANFFVRNQTKLFLIVDGLLVFLLWRIYLCPRHVIRKQTFVDLFFMAIHTYLIYTYGSILLFLLGYFVGGNYMLLNFALSHSHLPVAEEPKHWIEYCFSHTIDIEPSWWCDWLMGYLNYQIEHHLFPAMPQFRQKLIKSKVKELAEKHGLPYVTLTYWQALKKTFKNLEQQKPETKTSLSLFETFGEGEGCFN